MRLLLAFAALTLLLGGGFAHAAVGHSGARLYAQHCAACHGQDGKGALARRSPCRTCSPQPTTPT